MFSKNWLFGLVILVSDIILIRVSEVLATAFSDIFLNSFKPGLLMIVSFLVAYHFILERASAFAFSLFFFVVTLYWNPSECSLEGTNLEFGSFKLNSHVNVFLLRIVEGTLCICNRLIAADFSLRQDGTKVTFDASVKSFIEIRIV